MIVMRVSDSEFSTHIEPAYDENWSDLDKLRWHAAVVACDTGIELDIRESDISRNGRRLTGYYDVCYPSGVINAGQFDQAWSLISGISVGVYAARHSQGSP